ncbi:hypothetical protein SaccyDRAFT_1472 [Saccharomonospora cyanea NA-134]|uniref:HNH endonuclease n=1 Tax=Saccharomonospora cyanea NA-134 TaxID=882082 RepID=H5XEY1_9PSEU|nr:hypothetical protein SaccyDRAFT_1472 [Saccharomonospora cyanea NA-134]
MKVCSTPGCPELTKAGRCDECRRTADRRRGSSSQRGYGTRHARVFREAVLARQPWCALGCGRPSAHADHYPVDRRTLVLRGADPDDPANGRGLCHRCHSKVTAREHGSFGRPG